MALRRLRKFARTGAAEEFDLEGTVAATARDGGLLNVAMRPERRNAVSVLLLLDIGGSMDDHVAAAEALFGAARAEFKHLVHYYFHNFFYDTLWTQARRAEADEVRTLDVLRRYGPDWRVVIVGDAAMHPWEILAQGGCNEAGTRNPGRFGSSGWPRISRTSRGSIRCRRRAGNIPTPPCWYGSWSSSACIHSRPTALPRR
jgi:Uncharacterized protein conserved in bacteria